MRRIVTVVTPPSSTDVTTLARVKSELGITVSTYDTLLEAKINEASSDIYAYLRRDLARATVSERIWDFDSSTTRIVLSRRPVVSIASVTLDDVAVTTAEYRLDAESGILYALDLNSDASVWCITDEIVIQYVAGYIMPGESGVNLPAAIEGAAVELVSSYWFARGRDPTIRSENVPGLAAVTYWVGAVGGDESMLPPGVVAKLAPWKHRGAP